MFFVLCPGVFIKFPVKGGIKTIALIHAILFGIIYFVVTNVFGVLREGVAPKAAPKAKAAPPPPAKAAPPPPPAGRIVIDTDSCAPRFCNKDIAESKTHVTRCNTGKICQEITGPYGAKSYGFTGYCAAGTNRC